MHGAKIYSCESDDGAAHAGRQENMTPALKFTNVDAAAAVLSPGASHRAMLTTNMASKHRRVNFKVTRVFLHSGYK